MRDFLAELARFDAWANAELLTTLRSTPADDRVTKLLAHLAAAKHSWIGRVTGEVPPNFSLWPDWTREESARRLRLLDRELISLVGRDEPARIAKYSGTQGLEAQAAVADIITHISHHGSYHRGQLATAVKNAGGIPAVTDYIAWVRAGKPGVGVG